MKIFLQISVSISLCLILVLIAYSTEFLPIRSEKTLSVVKVAFPYAKEIAKFDPQRIQTATEANLARNMYARLFSLDDSGQLQGDLAKAFHWDGKSYVIEIHNNAKTNRGRTITIKDVELSLLRLLAKGESTHGSLGSLLCDGDQASLNGCPGLKIVDGKLILTPRHAQTKEFLINTLATPDFSILIESAVDWKSPDLPVLQHHETTGLYHLAEGLDPMGIVLKINPNSRYFSPKLLPEIQVIRAFGKEAAALFESGEVNLIPTFGIIKPSDFSDFNSLAANKHFSQPIQLRLFLFTQKGRGKFDSLTRMAIGEGIRKAYRENLLSSYEQPADQFFSSFGFGHINQNQMAKISTARENALNLINTLNNPGMVTIEVWPTLLREFQQALAPYEWAKVEKFRGFPEDRPSQDLPDLFYLGTDASSYEDVSLIHYLFKIEAFGTYKDGLQFLDKYAQTDSAEERRAMLEEIHFKALAESYAIPLVHISYLAVSDPSITLNLSSFFAGTPFWKVEKY